MFNGTCLCTACSSSAHRKLLFHRAAHLRAMTRSGRVKYLFRHKRFIANLNENHKLAAAPRMRKINICSAPGFEKFKADTLLSRLTYVVGLYQDDKNIINV
jgi:hypothetical protein